MMEPQAPSSLSRCVIEQLIDAAESGGVSSIISMMGKHANPIVGQDIAVASEMLGLLRHFMEKLPFYFSSTSPLSLVPGIHVNPGSNVLIALLPIGACELSLVAYWLCENVANKTAVELPGLLALPFTIDQRDETRWLIPEWNAMFYVDGSVEHCIPMLALKSVLGDDRFSDWVDVALERADALGLPTGRAKDEVHKVVIRKVSS